MAGSVVGELFRGRTGVRCCEAAVPCAAPTAAAEGVLDVRESAPWSQTNGRERTTIHTWTNQSPSESNKICAYDIYIYMYMYIEG